MTENDIFNLWNQKKQKIHKNPDLIRKIVYPKVKEVWMIALGQNIGYEQNGTGVNFSRPVLIIKKFNNQMYCVLPLSTKQKNLDFYFNFTDPFGYPVSAILGQIRLISVKRFYRKLYQIDSSNFSEIISAMQKLLIT